jgi:hypothetical protein
MLAMIMPMTLHVQLILLALATCSQAMTLGWTSNPYLIPPMPNSPTQYLVFHGPLNVNFAESRARCELMGGDLADVDDLAVHAYLHQRLHVPVFVGSFLGDRFRENCVALYPGGGVAIPDNNCGRLGSICEVPLHGTHALDLRGLSIPSDPAARVGKPSKQSNSSRPLDNHALGLEGSMIIADANNNSFLKGGRIGRPGWPAQSNNAVTVTVYGSIETDPALPCCKCCNAI